MQPLIDKFQINPETNKLFINIIEMFNNQPNYQLWAVKGIFNKTFDYDTLAKIHDWSITNQSLIKNLEKKNIVAYSTKLSIHQLLREMKALENVSLIKGIISHFNTDQRKMLMSSIIPFEMNGLQASNNKEINEWTKVFEKFNRLPSSRKNNFYTKVSGIRDITELETLIREAIDATYRWDKEDFIAYLENNTKGCEIVYDNDQVLIVQIPNFEMSKKLCGGGRTQWCISMEHHHWDDYVGGAEAERTQYFLFDFSRRETDPFAHVGFTIKRGEGIVEAQSCDNQGMISELSNGRETFNIHTLLKAVGANMGTFVHLPNNSKFAWDIESIIKYVKSCKSDYAIALERDKRIILNVLTYEGFINLTSHTLINNRKFIVDKIHKVYVVLDLNVPVNNENAVVAMVYEKSVYGDMSLKHLTNIFNADIIKQDEYFNKIGISQDDFMNRETIDPSVMLHKYIDEHNEEAAIKLIEQEKDNIDVSYQFNNMVPVFSALNNGMFKLFKKMIEHPTFNYEIEDGFSQSLLEALLYIYGADSVVLTHEEEKNLEDMIEAILNCDRFDLNAVDFNGDTALTIACEYEKMKWIAKALISKRNVNVNLSNEWGNTPLTVCMSCNNLEVLKELCKRPDLKVTELDMKVAKSEKINLSEYINPTESVFSDVQDTSFADIIAELESASNIIN